MPEHKPRTLRVRMAKGLVMPLPASIVVDSNITVLDDAQAVDVVDCRMVRRRIAVGDFVLVPPARPEEPAKPGKPLKEED